MEQALSQHKAHFLFTFVQRMAEIDDIDGLREHGRILVISNISKFGNVCRLIVAALSHDFVPILVGCSSMATEKLLFSAVGKDPEVVLHRVETLDVLAKWLLDAGYSTIGLEITDASEDITKMDRDTGCKVALMPGNEGTGLSASQKECCHKFVYIPQYSATIESYNVAVAATMVLSMLSTSTRAKAL